MNRVNKKKINCINRGIYNSTFIQESIKKKKKRDKRGRNSSWESRDVAEIVYNTAKKSLGLLFFFLFYIPSGNIEEIVLSPGEKYKQAEVCITGLRRENENIKKSRCVPLTTANKFTVRARKPRGWICFLNCPLLLVIYEGLSFTVLPPFVRLILLRCAQGNKKQ